MTSRHVIDIDDRVVTRRLPLAVCVLTLISLLASARPAFSTPECQSSTGHDGGDTSTAAAFGGTAARAGFRLGTGSRPFGWSTAIADLDADGRPDFAIADRVGSGARRFEYGVDVELSAGASQRLRVAPPTDAVAVVAEDIDADGDLDIVVTPALGSDVVAVWLNDGSGRFSAASLDHVPAHVPRQRRVTSPASIAPIDAVVIARRVAIGGPARPQIAANRDTTVRRIACSSPPSTSLRVSSPLGSRAPPASLVF